MKRHAPASWPLLRCAFAAAAFACAGSARAETVNLTYNLSVSGFGAADMAISATLDGDAYAITARGETYGAVSMFDDLVVDARANGIVANGKPVPATFGTDNILNGTPRRARVTWSPTGEALMTELVPTLAEEERTPIPDDARQGAFDPISALFAFTLGGPATGACTGEAKIFDGRRSYTLTLFPDAGGNAWVKRSIGDTEIIALKCTIQSVRTGGSSPGSWFSSSSGEAEHASIWFWRDPQGRAIPLRIEADAPIGTAVAELAALP